MNHDDAVKYLAQALCGEYYRAFLLPANDGYDLIHSQYVEASWFSWVPQANIVLQKIAMID